MTKKLWGGRFKKKTNATFEAFSSSLPVDWKLVKYDLNASAIHCSMLMKIGVLEKTSGQKIIKAINRIAKNLNRYEVDFRQTEFEDIHSLIESELIRMVGKQAKKIHTARSRNDQVNQATRMYCKDHMDQIIKQINNCQKAILKKASIYQDIVIPGMTHLQKAQPITVAHWLLSYIEALNRSKERLIDCYKRMDVLTLGSGALAGTAIPIDREFVCLKLGFSSISMNSLDSVGSRDVFAELVFDLALLGTDLSRVAEDLLIYQIEEISLVELPEALCTGSSMMPQKRNPDFLELMRGASSILIGNSTSLLTLLKGVPGSYNRDLQWDKEPIFRSVELVHQLLQITEDLFKDIRINSIKAKDLIVNDQLCATDLAEFMVMKGIPFREAHESIGKFVTYCENSKIKLADAPELVIQSLLKCTKKEISSKLNTDKSVDLKKSAGSTAKKRVAVQIKRWEKRLNNAWV